MSILIGEQAVVIGAGLGGLTAAAALSDYFANVIVLERDALPSQASWRKGVPQGRHLHLLLAGGQMALEELFPGFGQDLAAAGAVHLNPGLDARVEQPGYDPFPRRDLGLTVYAMSRPLLEHVVRHRAGRIGNVDIREKCNVREIIAAPGGAAATGVQYENADGISEFLPTEMVVDASGRGLPTLTFLGAHGHKLPEETTIGVDMRYATAVVALPAASDWNAVVSFPDPRANCRSGLLFPIENGQWMVALGGVNGDAPPGDANGFKAFAATLRTQTISTAIRDAAFIGEIARFAFPGSVRRHFDRLTKFPGGLLPVADAVCRFNPAFGQGMSVAAMEACILKRLLGTQPEQLAPAFFRAIQSVIETPWGVAKADFVFPGTTGERPADFEATMKFQAALTRLAAREQPIHKLVTEVRHLLKPGSVYREPALAQRVMAEMEAHP